MDVSDGLVFQNKYAQKTKLKVKTYSMPYFKGGEKIQFNNIPSESMDIVTIISTIEHFEGDGDLDIMDEVHRILRPEGLVYITVPYSLRYMEDHVHYQWTEKRYNLSAINERLRGDKFLKEQEFYFNDPNTQKNDLYTQKKDVLIEKIQRQKESIRKLHEPGFKSLAKPRSRLNKIQSNKDFLEENKQNAATMLTKKSSYPIISNEPEDFFTNNLENTKKINNMIANANQLLASNLTKIYGDRKKVNRNKEESFNNDLFNFFHKNKK